MYLRKREIVLLSSCSLINMKELDRGGEREKRGKEACVFVCFFANFKFFMCFLLKH